MTVDFPTLKWAVTGLFPEGLTLMAGAPKVGKSWLALGIAIAKACGGRAMSSIAVDQGDVLYLALEDTGRRLQRRLGMMLRGEPAPPNLTLAVECPTGQAGLYKIAEWIEKTPDPALIIIDVLQKFRGPPQAGQPAYAADYEAIGAIKQLADAYGVSVIVLTHVRKVSSDDWLDEISGTLGLSGAADTVSALKRRRGELDGVLHVTGRDVDEESYALQFTPEHGAWSLIGLESEHGLAENRRKILLYLRQNDGAKPSEIAIGTGLSRDLAKATCGRMANDSQLETDGHGRYFAPAPKET